MQICRIGNVLQQVIQESFRHTPERHPRDAKGKSIDGSRRNEMNATWNLYHDIYGANKYCIILDMFHKIS